jgi:hypothetical protein
MEIRERTQFLWKEFLNHVVNNITRQRRHVVVLFEHACVALYDIYPNVQCYYPYHWQGPTQQPATYFVLSVRYDKQCLLARRSFKGPTYGNGLHVEASLPMKETCDIRIHNGVTRGERTAGGYKGECTEGRCEHMVQRCVIQLTCTLIALWKLLPWNYFVKRHSTHCADTLWVLLLTESGSCVFTLN